MLVKELIEYLKGFDDDDLILARIDLPLLGKAISGDIVGHQTEVSTDLGISFPTVLITADLTVALDEETLKTIENAVSFMQQEDIGQTVRQRYFFVQKNVRTPPRCTHICNQPH